MSLSMPRRAQSRGSRSFLVTLGLSILLALACSDSPPTPADPTASDPSYVAAQFSVEAGQQQLRVLGAEPGSELALFDSEGMMVDEGVADAQGELLFTGLETGTGYVIRETMGAEREESGSLTVFAAATFSVRESVRQLHITGAPEGLSLRLYSSEGEMVDEGIADAWGSLIFREIAPGDGYVIHSVEGGIPTITDPLSVISAEDSLPEPEFYSNQTLNPGFNYITTRDGTTLSAYVYLPGPVEDGPYDVIVNYSGYEPSRPGAPFNSPYVPEICPAIPVLCDTPGHPAGLLAGIFGFASVGVNIRGTGCSGGAYDYFEELQILDGYDLIEVIAAQEWVKHGKVGMAGLSYPGITQLFVAQTQPPGLAAIAPLSVLADTAASTLAPGGIFNPGFALQWAENVYNNAQPYGQGWSNDRIAVEAESGVTTCDDNQKLHAQAVDAVEKALRYPYYDAAVADSLAPILFADKIEVPVFLAGPWQDEQTGPHFATLLDKFTNVPAKRLILTTGLHADGYTPQIMSDWISFLKLYVSQEVPYVNPTLASLSETLFEAFLGVPIELPTLPFSDADIPGITYEEAKAGFESQLPVRVIFENGYGQEAIDKDAIGAPVGAFELGFSHYPPPETTALRLYMNADGSLRPTPPEEEQSASSYLHDPEAGGRTFGGSQPFYIWPPTPADSAVVFVSDPLDEDLIMLGSASVDLYLQSDSEEAELEVTLSEVSPDGNETYVQGGWLRATQRHLAPDATELRPTKTHLEEDASPLPAGEWELTRVEIMPFAHVFRVGSRIVIKVDTPGDSRELWEFTLQVTETDIRNRIAHDAAHPSSVALPVIAGAVVPAEAGRPECPSLRGQPCRVYEPYVNTLEP
ncbi:MAG: CocE/NonD family hydrolase [Myxococcota bacterium]|nr:CocE/NonD family hydrolase [Myxococcota bacterium]